MYILVQMGNILYKIFHNDSILIGNVAIIFGRLNYNNKRVGKSPIWRKKYEVL